MFKIPLNIIKASKPKPTNFVIIKHIKRLPGCRVAG